MKGIRLSIKDTNHSDITMPDVVADKSGTDATLSNNEKKENDRIARQTSEELNGMNIFAFLILMFMDSTGKGDALNDDLISKISSAFGLGDGFKQAINSVRSGEISAFKGATQTYNSIDTKNVDWSKSSELIHGDTLQSAMAHIKLREGYENTVYRDNGKLAVGVGHLITPSDNLKLGDTISDAQVMKFLEHDAAKAYNAAIAQAKEIGIDDNTVIAGLTSVNFQLGSGWNKEHKDTWALMKQGDFQGAITEAADSNWNSQAPIRVKDFQGTLLRASNIKSGAIAAESTENKQYASLNFSSSSDQDLSSKILRIARTDNASKGYCAKGVGNIMEKLGVDVTRGNAHTWDESLPRNGWIKLEGLAAENAPVGAISVFDRDSNYRGKVGGHQYGHIEVAALDNRGNKIFVSDKARDNSGGRVPGNFAGVFVHPKLHGELIASLNKPTESSAIITAFNDGGIKDGGVASADKQQPQPLDAAFNKNGQHGVDQVAAAAVQDAMQKATIAAGEELAALEKPDSPTTNNTIAPA